MSEETLGGLREAECYREKSIGVITMDSEVFTKFRVDVV